MKPLFVAFLAACVLLVSDEQKHTTIDTSKQAETAGVKLQKRIIIKSTEVNEQATVSGVDMLHDVYLLRF
jgi:hypothetical protein